MVPAEWGEMLARPVLGLLVVLRAAAAAPYQPPTDYAAAISRLQTLPTHQDSQLDPSAWHRREVEQYRREEIARQILSYLKLPCLPQPPEISSNSRQLLSQLTGLVQNRTAAGHRDQLQRTQSLPPSCDWPAAASLGDPRQPRPSLRVFFNLTTFFSTLPQHATIEAAQLRLYKRAGVDLPSARPASTGQPTARLSAYVFSPPHTPGGVTNATWRAATSELGTPLTNWVALDVRSAVLAWRGGLPNLGLLLTLSDSHSRLLDPRRHFQQLSCDDDAPGSPVPGLLMDAAEQRQVALLPGQLYPLLDLRTSEPASTGGGSADHTGQTPTTVPCVQTAVGTDGSPTGPSPPPYRGFAPLSSSSGAKRFWRSHPSGSVPRRLNRRR